MTTLTDFLLARIAEDEGAATELRDQYPHSPGPSHLSGNWDIVRVATGYARVLAECEAKRRIVEEHYYMPGHESRDFGFENGNCVACRKQGPCPTLRLLALPYANHPDYSEEWKP